MNLGRGQEYVGIYRRYRETLLVCFPAPRESAEDTGRERAEIVNGAH